MSKFNVSKDFISNSSPVRELVTSPGMPVNKKKRNSDRKIMKFLSKEQVMILKRCIASGKYYAQQLAEYMGVNPGRISELRHGKRETIKVLRFLPQNLTDKINR